MKTEDFDDAIRRKLENIDYAFKSQDIERIHQYVQRNSTYRPFWKRYFQLFILSANGLILIGSLIWNYKQVEQQKVFSENIETLQKIIAQAKVNSTSSKLEETSAVLKKESLGLENKPEDYPITASVGGSGSDHRYLYNNSPYYDGKDTRDNNDLVNLSSQNELIEFENIRQEGENSIHSTNELKLANQKKQDNNGLIYLAKSKAENKRDSVVIDSLVKKEKANKDSIIRPEIIKKKLHVKNHLSLKNLGYRAGCGLEKANNQIGVTLLGELFVSKRFSINAGIKMLSITNDHYKDEEEFYNKRKEQFNTAWVPNLPNSSLSAVSDIDMRYSLIQLPVAISYYQPLNTSYSLIFSAGTDFDLRTQLHLNYKLGGQDGIQRKVSSGYPNVFFNNVALSVGVQKQWNRFNIQLSPFVSPQIKQVDYKKDNLYGGLRLRVFYRFK